MADDPKPSDPSEPAAPAAPEPPAATAPKAVAPAPKSADVGGPAPAAKAAAAAPAARPAPSAASAATAPKAAGAAAAAKPAPKAVEHPPKASAPTGPPDPPPPADKTPPAFIASMEAAMPGTVTQVSYWVGDWTVIVPVARILDVARYLRDAPDALFDTCSDVTATDWPPRAERFDLVYCLYSTRHRHRVRVKARAGELEPVSSVTSVWLAADWLEREVYDMFGVNFVGHPDRRRILMPEDWQGFPQRKDYPLEGPGELLMENPLDWLKLKQSMEESDIE
jgi:NADH/F420H2 dehydrogenase subunit C